MENFLKLKRKKLNKVQISKKKDLKVSLREYLESELKELKKRTDLTLKVLRNGKTKEIRMWGELNSENEVRLTLLGNKKKLYLSEDDCINRIDLIVDFESIEQLCQVIEGLIENLDRKCTFYYRRKKNSDEIVKYEG